jgi:hypothetical protein
MASCKDCIHNVICSADAYFKEREGAEAACVHFKPKSRYIELPCAVGVKVYFAGFDSGECLNGSLVSYCLDAAHLWFNCHYDCGLNYWHPIEDFGKTVFLTKEEAEKALERSDGK